MTDPKPRVVRKEGREHITDHIGDHLLPFATQTRPRTDQNGVGRSPYVRLAYEVFAFKKGMSAGVDRSIARATAWRNRQIIGVVLNKEDIIPLLKRERIIPHGAVDTVDSLRNRVWRLVYIVNVGGNWFEVAKVHSVIQLNLNTNHGNEDSACDGSRERMEDGSQEAPSGEPHDAAALPGVLPTDRSSDVDGTDGRDFSPGDPFTD